jgi:DNA polymerase III epsilon subunit family exonuclease
VTIVSPSSSAFASVNIADWSLEPPSIPFAVLDVETTGLSPSRDRIIEIAVVRCATDGSVIDEWSTLVNPGRDPGPTHIHGISAADLTDAPAFCDIAEELTGRLSGYMVTAHNLSFDAGFLSAEYTRAGLAAPDQSALCTLQLARFALRDLSGYSLAACAAALGIDHPDAHRALPDTRVTASVLREMILRLHPPTDQDTLPFD